MQEYTYIRTVGEGAYGDVWLTQRRGGSYCAVKVFKQAHEDTEIKALAKREAHILQSVSHINCVKLLDAFKSKSGRVYLVFEYVERSLLGELDVQPLGLTPAATKLIAWQLLQATAYLHGLKIVHRDIKPANILLTPQGLLKLCDFGFARFTRCGSREVQPLSTYVVTRWYRPPEVLVSAPYGPSADIWSIGCTLAEVATGRPLFPGRSTADQLWRIMCCRGTLPRHLADRLGTDPRLRGIPIPTPSRSLRQRLPELDPRLHQLIDECLQLDPEARLSAKELLQLPYFWDVPLLVAGSPLAGLYSNRAQPFSSEMAAASAGGVVGMPQKHRPGFGEGRRHPLDDQREQQGGGMKKKQGLSSEGAVGEDRKADGWHLGGKDGNGQQGDLDFQKLREAQRDGQLQQRAEYGAGDSCGEAGSVTAAVAGNAGSLGAAAVSGVVVMAGRAADVHVEAHVKSAGVQGSGVATEPSGPNAKAAVGDEAKLVCEPAHAAEGLLSGQEMSGLKTPSTDKTSTTNGQWRKQVQEQQQHQVEEEGASVAGIPGSGVLQTMPAASLTRSIVTSSKWRWASSTESVHQDNCDVLPGTLSSPGGTLMEPTTVAAVKAAARLGLSLPYNPHGTPAAGGESRSVSDEPTAAVTFTAIERDAADGAETCMRASLICPVAAAGTGSCRTIEAAAAADMTAQNSQSEQLLTLPLPAVTATVSSNCLHCTAAGDSATMALMPSLASGNPINSFVTGNLPLSRLPTVAAPSCHAATAANGGRQYDTAQRQPPPINTVATFGSPPCVGSPPHGTFSDTRLMRLRVQVSGGAARGLRTTAQCRGIFGHHSQHQQASAQQGQILALAAARASVGAGGRARSSLGQIREPDSGFEHGDDDDESCGRIGRSDLGYTAAARTVIDGGAAGWARAGGRLQTQGGAGPGADQELESLRRSGFAFPALQMPYDRNSTGGGDGLAAGGVSSCGVLLDSIPFGELLTPAGAPDMPSYNGVPPPHRRPPVPSSGSPWFTPSQNNDSDSLFLLTSFNRNPAVTGSQRASLHEVIISDIEQAGCRPTESESVAVVSSCTGIGVGAEGSVNTFNGDMGTTPCSSQSSATAAARGGGSCGILLVRIGRSGGSASGGTAAVPHGSDSGVHVRASSLRAQPAQRSRLGSGLWGSDGPPPEGSTTAGLPAAAVAIKTTVTQSGRSGSAKLSTVHAVTAIVPSPPMATTNNITSVPYSSSPRGASQRDMESAGSRPSLDSLAVMLSAGVQLSPAESAGVLVGPHRVAHRPAQQQPQQLRPPPPQPNPRRVGLIREAWRQAVGRVPAVDSRKVVVQPVANGITARTAVEVADGEGVVLHGDAGTTTNLPAAAAAAAVEGKVADKVGEGEKMGGWAVVSNGAAAVQHAARLGAAVAVEASSGAVVYGNGPDNGQEVEAGEKMKKKKGVKGLWRSISKALGLRPSTA